MTKRTPMVAGNWKMHKTVAETRELVYAMSAELNKIDGVEKIVCPPASALLAASALLEGTGIGLGAQNMYWENEGAFTGELSPLMVKEFCRYVIVGHSERRAYFGETDQTVNKKILAAQQHGLVPIVCVGETLEENEAGRTAEVVRRQVRDGLQSVRPEFAPRVVIAYEPVWAIGTGRAASGEDANAVLADVIRPSLAELFGVETAQVIRILYGGSVKGVNAAEFFTQPEIDGALVGGASLNVSEFTAITKAASR